MADYMEVYMAVKNKTKQKTQHVDFNALTSTLCQSLARWKINKTQISTLG